jgi:hypothetical protein
MNGQISVVLEEIEEYVSYSLRDFFFLVSEKVDKDQINPKIINIVTIFLMKFPMVGWSPDLVIMVYFFLCLGSEALAY